MSKSPDTKTVMARFRHWGLEHKQQRRFDRWCHGGEVSYRLPLGVRLHAANRFPRPRDQVLAIIP